MSTESILAIIGMVLTVALAVFGVVVGLVGFLLSRQLRQFEDNMRLIPKLCDRMTRVETVLGVKSGSDAIRVTRGDSA